MVEVNDRDRLAMVSELAMASGVAGTCGGQALDLEAEGRQVTLEQLERIHRHKTGALIRAAVRPGALSAGERGRKALPILDRYAESIGLAFGFRMTFWMWWAILQHWENVRVRISSLAKVPTPPCWALSMPNVKPGI